MSQQRESTVVALGPPATRTPRLLAWALRVVDAGPRLVGRAALLSLTVTCVLSIAVALYLRPAGALIYPQEVIIVMSLAGLFVAGVIALNAVLVPAGRRAALPDRLVAPEVRAAIWLALAIWFPFLVVVAYYR